MDINEQIKDITHTDSGGIRGTCGDPCYQCQRDKRVKQSILKAIMEGLKLNWKPQWVGEDEEEVGFQKGIMAEQKLVESVIKEILK